MSAYLDPEFLLAEVVAGWLRDQVSTETQEACPVVEFSDPMSVDAADRIVVMVPSGESDEEWGGNGTFQLDIGIKTQWQQSDIDADFAKHRARIKEVRTILWDSDLQTSLETQSDGQIGVSFVHPKRGFKTQVYDGWLYTETNLTVQIYLKEQA